MSKNSLKFIFFAVVVFGAVFAHAMYLAIRNNAQQASIAAADGATPSSSSGFVAPFLNSADGVSTNVVLPSEDNQTSTSTSSPFLQTGSAPAPSLGDEASLVADLTTGTAFESLNPDVRWPTASLTKLMTATLIFDNIATSTRITITPEMFAADPDETTLVVGESYTVEDLLHVMLMPSSNVAAEVMADFYGRTQFMQMMNARAQAWGMTSTYFDDPSGISAANESTIHDMLILAQHVYQDYPGILAITDTPVTTITELNSGKKVTVKSINDFAGEPNFIGGKTGHTTQAGGNLLSIFNYQNRPVIVIVLDSFDRFGDTSKLYAWFRANYK